MGASQTLFLRSTQSAVVTATAAVNALSTTQGTAGTTPTGIKQAKSTGTWQFIPGTASNTTTITPGITPDNAGWIFDAQPQGITYDAGTWTVTIETTNTTTSGTDAVKVSMWVVTANTTAVTSVTQIANAVASSTYTVSTTKAAHTVTFNPGAVSINAGQYLYIEVYMTCTVATGSTTATEKIEVDDTGTNASKIVTPSYTSSYAQGFSAVTNFAGLLSSVYTPFTSSHNYTQALSAALNASSTGVKVVKKNISAAMTTVASMVKRSLHQLNGAITVSTLGTATSSPVPNQHGTANATNAVVNVTLPSAAANDIIVIAAYSETASNGTNRTISSISGGGLAFNTYARSHGSNQGSMDVWWALTSGALGSTTFSVTFSGTYDDASVIVFGVSGAKGTGPFDPNASLPATYSTNSSGVAPTFSGISTTNAADLLFMVVGANNSNTLSSPPTGWSLLANISNGGGTQFSNIGAATLSVSSPVISQTYTWGQTLNTAGGTEGVLLAFTAPSGSGGFSRSSNHTVTAALLMSSVTAKAIARALTSSFSPSGLLQKALSRAMAATLSFTGLLGTVYTAASHSYQQTLSATLSSVSVSTRSVVKVTTASLSFLGTVGRSAAKLLTAIVNTTDSFMKGIGKTFSANLTVMGSIFRKISTTRTAIFTSGSTFNRATKKIQTASNSLTGGFNKAALHFQTAVFATSGSITKSLYHLFTAVSSFAGNLVTSYNSGAHAFTQTLTASLNFTSVAAKSAGRILVASFTGSGSLQKSVFKVFVAILTTGSTISKATTKGFTAALSFSGSLLSSRFIQILLSASLALQSRISKSVGTLKQASLSSTSAAVRVITQVLTGGLGFIGALILGLVSKAIKYPELILNTKLITELNLQTQVLTELPVSTTLITQVYLNTLLVNELALSTSINTEININTL